MEDLEMMKHQPIPSDEEIDEMYVESESKEYQNAH